MRFNEYKAIKAVLLQGRDTYLQWVTQYKVSYSLDCATWIAIQDGGQDKVLNLYIYFVVSLPVNVMTLSISCVVLTVDL